jgi:hypothetical protein
MPDRHKHEKIGVRLPEADRAWVMAEHERTGKPVNRIIAEAVRALRKAEDAADVRDADAAWAEGGNPFPL